MFVGGCASGQHAPLPTHPLHYDELDLRGAFHHSPAEVDRALALLAEGAVDWRALAAGPIGLDELPSALAERGGPARKWVVINPPMTPLEQQLVDPLRRVELHPVARALDPLVAPLADDEGSSSAVICCLDEVVVARAPEAERRVRRPAGTARSLEHRGAPGPSSRGTS